MTNKLRSVIDETNKYIDRRSCRRDFLDRDMVLDTEEAKEILNESFTKLLDAIIEEIEEQRWKTTKNSYNSAQNELIDFFTEKFKQAREELSTSLTQ